MKRQHNQKNIWVLQIRGD